ncbi:DNA polymerase III subunit gamma/tau [Nordella sp. HKS 07]|uniref:DNA polymerase III subunit gamma/tau n=1 Tax=Nordella sp. HKS 07 TaxID=2712222 RepID=UPI0013E1B3BE|nr:DNA polymerase III subunit gamma/tau [Nordella sp. HKS 07]QIG50049.1 DNA polymerase III subunit gamma/tau [Nordella sp. HKS 07]
MTEEASGASAHGYRVLARKYRPRTFADLIGQEAVVRTLSNAFATGRIAQAYMLTGVRGVGKTTTARLIARALNYPGGPSVDMPEVTPDCEAILESRHIDVIEMDAASNTGVDDVREIIEGVRYAPIQARYKVYIIDEVHMLSKNAFNALLKTLEEPPPHVKFIFATTEIRKVPVTILSRCQRFDLRRMDAEVLMQLFGKVAKAEAVTIEDDALRMIARAAEGSARDGLSLLDQAIAYGSETVKAAEVGAMLGLIDRTRVIELFDAVMAGDAATAIKEIETQHQAGGDPHTILSDLADYVHWVTRLKVAPKAAGDVSRSETERQRGQEHAAKISMPHLTRAWQMLLKGLKEIELHSDQLMAAEMVLIRLAYAASLPTGEDLVKLAREGSPAPREQRSSPRQEREDGPPPVENGQLAVASDPANERPQERSVETRPFAHLSDIAAYVGEKRDIRLKNQIENLMRHIRVSPGQIEVALEASAPPGLVNELGRKLNEWTGQRWMVLVARDGGEKPLAEQRRDKKDTIYRETREHPDVQAILQRFPGAEIVDVRDFDSAATPVDDMQTEKDLDDR